MLRKTIHYKDQQKNILLSIAVYQQLEEIKWFK